MQYFDFSGLNNFLSDTGKTYTSDSPSAKWYFDTRRKLQHLITLLSAQFGVKFINNYNEKPNRQAGRGKPFTLKGYILAGFVPPKFKKLDKKAFIKLSFFPGHTGSFQFGIDVDVNFSDNKNPYTSNRDLLQKDTKWEVSVNEDFPSDWDSLLQLISPIIKERLDYFDSFFGKNQATSLAGEPNVAYKPSQLGTMHPLNQILFGPPGTGKTYNTINKALEIIDEEAERELDLKDREAVKAQFHKRVEEGRIVFSTFHQNMAYEDFIEGIKPSLEDDENERVNYSIVDGVLKSLSKKALSAYFKILEKTEENREVTRIQLFDEAWNNLAESIQFKLDNQEYLELSSKNNKPMRVLKITQQGNFILQPKLASLEEYTVSYKRIQKLFEAFPNLDAVKNIDKEFRQVIGGANSTAYWCVLNYLNSWVESNSTSTLPTDLKPVNESLISFDNQIVKADKEVPRYVLIIDEINRGNVSQIFGELITLIEEDKRLGKEEALLATLPYSKKKFGVPPNLYLIGTMNTADRSVEALDTALRRRFHFQEMPPVPELIRNSARLKANEGIIGSANLATILATINARIEKLLDKDHLIGHSFFMQVNTVDKLKEAFQNKIIPLLQEYFYGDFGKIELVLGAGFVREKHKDVKVLFAKSRYDISGLEDKPVYELVDYTTEVEFLVEIDKVSTKVDFNKAIELLLNAEAG